MKTSLHGRFPLGFLITGTQTNLNTRYREIFCMSPTTIALQSFRTGLVKKLARVILILTLLTQSTFADLTNLWWRTGSVDNAKWKQENGKWTSPDYLAENESASIYSEVDGPAQLTIELGATAETYEAEIVFKLNNKEEITLSYPTTVIDISSPHREPISITIKSNSEGQYTPVSLDNLRIQYGLDIEVLDGTFKPSIPLEKPDPDRERYTGFIELNFFSTMYGTAIPSNQGVGGLWFQKQSTHWGVLTSSNDLQQFTGAGLSFIHAPAVEAFETSFANWTSDTANRVTVAPDEADKVYIHDSEEPLTLSTTIIGPGDLTLSPTNHLDLEYRLIGEPFQPLPYSNIEIPSGTHNLDIKVQTIDPEGRTSAEPIIFSFTEGYRFQATHSAGGNILIKTVDSPYVPEGAKIALEAIPANYNDFLYWTHPFEEEGPAFTFNADKNVDTRAVFGVKLTIEEFTWTFEGVHPGLCLSCVSDYRYLGQLIWSPEELSNGDKVLARATFTGHGLFLLPRATMGHFTSLTVTVDGETLEPKSLTRPDDFIIIRPGLTDYHKHFEIYETDLADGNHELIIEFEYEEPYETTSPDFFEITDLELGYPALIKPFSIENYTAWMNTHSSVSSPLAPELTPSSDLDNDGVPNYYEYLFNWDPSINDELVSIQSTDENTLLLRTKKLPNDHKRKLQLKVRSANQYWPISGATSATTSAQLGSPVDDPNNEGYQLREIYLPENQTLENADWLWFWYKFLEEIPETN